MAREETRRRDRPGGTPRAFWEAVKTTSIPQFEKSISSQPTEQTPSTMMRVSGETRLTSSATLLISDRTPVEVSTCVIVMTLYSFSLRASSI
jgi:hypothetical protein